MDVGEGALYGDGALADEGVVATTSLGVDAAIPGGEGPPSAVRSDLRIAPYGMFQLKNLREQIGRQLCK
jgi:hypothetical protein